MVSPVLEFSVEYLTKITHETKNYGGEKQQSSDHFLERNVSVGVAIFSNIVLKFKQQT